MTYASCCVCSYERPNFLLDCLDSLPVGAGGDMEVIVHDDGSVNNATRRIIDRRLEDGRITAAILNPRGHNQGRGVAMNRCFAMATGDPMIIIDQDLVFHPGWLGQVNRLLEENPQIGLLSGYRYWHKPCDWRDTIIAQHDGWSEHAYIMGSFMAIRRACWEELGPFEEYSEAFAEDHVFQRKVAAHDFWVCGTPDEDLMENVGYGIGPSTVVQQDGSVKSIHKTPLVIR